MTKGVQTPIQVRGVEKLYSGTMITRCCPRLLDNITVFIERLFGLIEFSAAPGRRLEFDSSEGQAVELRGRNSPLVVNECKM